MSFKQRGSQLKTHITLPVRDVVQSGTQVRIFQKKSTVIVYPAL